MLANLKLMDFQMADYWALHFQMETQRGWKMVHQLDLDSRMVDYWALHLQMETQRGLKMVDQKCLDSQMVVDLAHRMELD